MRRSDSELETLLQNKESDRVEFKEITRPTALHGLIS
jgi:hypothetical protein